MGRPLFSLASGFLIALALVVLQSLPAYYLLADEKASVEGRFNELVSRARPVWMVACMMTFITVSFSFEGKTDDELRLQYVIGPAPHARPLAS